MEGNGYFSSQEFWLRTCYMTHLKANANSIESWNCRDQELILHPRATCNSGKWRLTKEPWHPTYPTLCFLMFVGLFLDTKWDFSTRKFQVVSTLKCKRWEVREPFWNIHEQQIFTLFCCSPVEWISFFFCQNSTPFPVTVKKVKIWFAATPLLVVITWWFWYDCYQKRGRAGLSKNETWHTSSNFKHLDFPHQHLPNLSNSFFSQRWFINLICYWYLLFFVVLTSISDPWTVPALWVPSLHFFETEILRMMSRRVESHWPSLIKTGPLFCLHKNATPWPDVLLWPSSWANQDGCGWDGNCWVFFGGVVLVRGHTSYPH